jgi:hypothetical protein
MLLGLRLETTHTLSVRLHWWYTQNPKVILFSVKFSINFNFRFISIAKSKAPGTGIFSDSVGDTSK